MGGDGASPVSSGSTQGTRARGVGLGRNRHLPVTGPAPWRSWAMPSAPALTPARGMQRTVLLPSKGGSRVRSGWRGRQREEALGKRGTRRQQQRDPETGRGRGRATKQRGNRTPEQESRQSKAANRQEARMMLDTHLFLPPPLCHRCLPLVGSQTVWRWSSPFFKKKVREEG